MRKIHVLSFIVLLALVLVAISPVYGQEEGKVVIPAGEKIKIAVGTDLTNAIPQFGQDIANAATLAVAQKNEAGGILGFEIELVVEDDRCTGDDATAVANRVVSDPQIVAVVGHICSGATTAASDVYEQALIPMMSPSATAVSVTTRGNTVVNRVAFSDGNQGTMDAHYLYKVLGIRKLAVLHDNDTYGLGLAEVVRDVFTELGGEVVAFEGINVADQDFRPVLTPLVAAEPEAIFFGGYVQQAVLLVPQKNDVGLEDVIFFSDDGVFGQALIDGAGDAAEGVYASFADLAKVAEANPERVGEFDTAYEELFDIKPDDLGPFHYHAYDSANIIMAAIEAVGEVDADGNLVIDRQVLVDAVRATADFDGLTGMLTCDEKGDCGANLLAINIVEDGEWVPVEIPEDLLTMEAE